MEMEPVKSGKRVVPIRKGHPGLGLGMEWTQERLLAQLEEWRRYLQEQDRSVGTVEKYVEAVQRFLSWYGEEEGGGGEGGAPLQLEALTPIALIGYRNHLQHEQQKSVSTINLRISALRAWCGWLVDQGYLTSDPSARVTLVSTNRDGGSASGPNSKREGLTGPQINALLRQAQASGEAERNYAILQVLLQTGIRLSECSGLRFGTSLSASAVACCWCERARETKLARCHSTLQLVRPWRSMLHPAWIAEKTRRYR